MTALPELDPETASAAAAEQLNLAKAAFGGSLPKLARVMANSPAVLSGYLRLSAALADGMLAGDVTERIALLVAEENACSYCLSAHAYLAEHVAKLSRGEIVAARRGDSADARTRAVLQLASAVNTRRGRLDDGHLEAARAAGLSNAEIAEVVGQVALNVLTNYFAKAAHVRPEFPLVRPGESAA